MKYLCDIDHFRRDVMGGLPAAVVCAGRLVMNEDDTLFIPVIYKSVIYVCCFAVLSSSVMHNNNLPRCWSTQETKVKTLPMLLFPVSVWRRNGLLLFCVQGAVSSSHVWPYYIALIPIP